MRQSDKSKEALVRYRAATAPQSCPYGQVQRVVTGGEGGVANVHVVAVERGSAHVHDGYDEVYYVLAGEGELTIGDRAHRLCPGAVAVIPAGAPHALRADPGQVLEFVIFGTPPAPIDDPRLRPRQP